MLVRLLLSEVFDNRLTPRTEGITGVQDVDDDVGRVEDLVQFSPYTTRGTLGIDRFSGGRGGRVICVGRVERVVSFYEHQLGTRLTA